jgi:muramoyltetrapeptide carboxypeptidase
MAIVAKSMICTIHGPNILQIPKLSLAARTHLFKLIEQSKPLGKLSLSDLQVISNGVAQGILIGGNLSLISHLVGTQFFPCPKDKILFLEDIDEPPYKIDRMLTHLILSDILTQVRGIILGDFSKCKSRSGNSFSVFEVLRERLQGLGIPVLSGFKAGHIPSNLALPMGCQVRLECTDKGAQLSFEESPCI